MILTIELTELEIRKVLASHLSDAFGINVAAEDVPIEVKSKQNYRSEWEPAAIRICAKVVK